MSETIETTPEVTETTPELVEPQDPTTDPEAPTEAEETGKTFDLAYVQKLRKEAAGYREKAGRVDELGTRLHKVLVEASGRLQDPTDLPYDPAHLDDPDALAAAIDALVAAKPHLKSRRPQGFIPQGATPPEGPAFSLSGAIRQRVGG